VFVASKPRKPGRPSSYLTGPVTLVSSKFENLAESIDGLSCAFGELWLL
jgi:hypothetical protein